MVAQAIRSRTHLSSTTVWTTLARRLDGDEKPDAVILDGSDDAAELTPTTGPGRRRGLAVDRQLPLRPRRQSGSPNRDLALSSCAPSCTLLWDHPPDDAGYIRRLANDRDYAAHGIGGELLDYASQLVAGTGRRWLRPDCAKNNTRLHDYYRAHGFNHLRTIDLPHHESGALFQRPAARTPDFDLPRRLRVLTITPGDRRRRFRRSGHSVDLVAPTTARLPAGLLQRRAQFADGAAMKRLSTFAVVR